jgi:Bacterial type II and III secretion system protein.
MEKTIRGTLMCAVLATAALCFGQQAESKGKSDATEAKAAQAVEQTEAPQEERSFQLTFTVRELDENGKVVNSRKYVTMAATGPRANGGGGNIRTGAKIPVPTGANSSQFTYLDVGANFDVSRVRVIKSNRVAMQVTAEISSFDSPATTSTMATIRQNRWTGEVQVPIGGRTVFFSADDLASKKSMQIELAVTPVAER